MGSSSSLIRANSLLSNLSVRQARMVAPAPWPWPGSCGSEASCLMVVNTNCSVGTGEAAAGENNTHKTTSKYTHTTHNTSSMCQWLNCKCVCMWLTLTVREDFIKPCSLPRSAPLCLIYVITSMLLLLLFIGPLSISPMASSVAWQPWRPVIILPKQMYCWQLAERHDSHKLDTPTPGTKYTLTFEYKCKGTFKTLTKTARHSLFNVT